MKGLYKLEEKLCEELSNIGERDNITANSIDKIDTMAHALKNIEKIIQNKEGYSQAEGGYSNRMSYRNSYDGSYAGSYDDGYSRYSMDGGSYARRRDSMGRYSRAGNADELKQELMRIAGEVPPEMKRQVDSLINELGRM